MLVMKAFFPHRLKKIVVWMFLAAAVLLALLAATIMGCNVLVASYGRYSVDSLAKLPDVYCILVLGTSKWVKTGMENQYYRNRIEAAAQLYHSGKCKKVLVSGDNRTRSYNEPIFMRRDLLRLGVPAADIVCDFAGLRTLDSVIRFHRVFGQKEGIVVSQKFHNSRAIYIARHNGIELVGYNAKDVGLTSGIKTKLREIFSKFFCVLDVTILDTQPRFLGDPIKI